MKIGFADIWEFLEETGADESGWHINLVAGKIAITNVKPATIISFRDDKAYDQEMIIDLFAQRHILWQPDTGSKQAVNSAGLRIFLMDCQSYTEKPALHPLCRELLTGLIMLTEKVLNRLAKDSSQGRKRYSEYRRRCFPVVLCFILHPGNRTDHRQEAWRKLNYWARVQLTQHNHNFTELEFPYWEVKRKE